MASYTYHAIPSEGDPRFSKRYTTINQRKRYIESIAREHPIKADLLKLLYHVQEGYYKAVDKL